MKLLHVGIPVVIASITFLAVACAVDVDITNKSCPCGPDYVCDTSRNICVTPAELVADGGVVLDDGAVVGCPDDKCPCQKDGDCKDPARARCEPSQKICVECLREPSDTCPAGSYCSEDNHCTLGCKQESDCQISPAVPHCNLGTHQCVACVDASHCSDAGVGLLCSPSGSCVEGCNDAGVGCSAGKSCCDGFCLDIQRDLLNCGACGTKCSTLNGTPSCAGGNCNFNNCAQGFRHCAPGNTGCETNIRTDVTKCGSCTRNCLVDVKNANGISCNAGFSCAYQSCKPGFGNCDLNVGTGCECACGSFAGDICCPGGVCSFPGGKCSGNNKCVGSGN